MAGNKLCILVSGGLDSAVLVAMLARRGRPVVPVYIRQGLRWEPVEQYWLMRWLRQMEAAPRLSGQWLRPMKVAPLVTLTVPAADLYPRHWGVTGIGVPRAADPDEAVWLPGRNLLLVAKAAVYCALHQIPRIALGTLKGNPFADAQPAFRRALGRVLTVGLGAPVSVVAPLASLTKPEIIRRGRHLPLHWTFSCIHPTGRRHCGRCQKCGERRRGFWEAGVADPTLYA